MRIQVFDVGHGGCALVTFPNGVRVMLDCGYNAARPWYPSDEFAGQWIDLLVALNLDEDHLDDLPYLLQNVELGGIATNPTVGAAALNWMKPDGMRSGVETMYRLLPRFDDGLLGKLPAELGDAYAWFYCNPYPFFTKTNDLSMAVFVRRGAFTALFAGDLEGAGWRNLLKNSGFVRDLRTVNVLVASHHGRRTGCCPDLFEQWQPNCVIFSDSDIEYGTQETTNWYSCRATGIPDYTKFPNLDGTWPRRRVFTTRSDGRISLDVQADGFYVVTSERSRALPAPSSRSALSGQSNGIIQTEALFNALIGARR